VREDTDLPCVLLCGHTHVPAAYYADAGTADAITAFALPPNERIHLENRLYLFNVGSVGHSRVGPSTETRYPVLDTVASTIEMRVMSYPAGELVQALRRTYSFSLFIKLKEYFENPPPDPRYLI
jgi:hypothetical protein